MPKPTLNPDKLAEHYGFNDERPRNFAERPGASRNSLLGKAALVAAGAALLIPSYFVAKAGKESFHYGYHPKAPAAKTIPK